MRTPLPAGETLPQLADCSELPPRPAPIAASETRDALRISAPPSHPNQALPAWRKLRCVSQWFRCLAVHHLAELQVFQPHPSGFAALPSALLLLAFTVQAQTYKLQTPTGLLELTPEAYTAGVVTGESGDFQSPESLKAMAIAARTYAARMRGRHAKEGFDFCTTTHCQRYVAPSARATKAAQDTAGQLLWYQNKPAFTVYSRSCGGKTENVTAVWPDIDAPYLSAHPDPYCSRPWVWSGTPEEITQALTQSNLKSPTHLRTITIVKKTPSGRAQTLSLDGQLLSASTFRFALGRVLGWNTIRSEKYTIENTGTHILFRGSGEGHGVGLCQTGADTMGRQGQTYRQILEFYYPGTTIGTHATELHWTRLSGEGVILYTLRPDSDRTLITTAETLIHNSRSRFPWHQPNSIDIYVYPDLNTFRNATGEPGWVAARTTGTKIEMQPTAILRSHNALQSTLEHELLHSSVESAARPGLPVWFREGLVEYLTGSQFTQNKGSSENDMRQRTNRQAAENAYQSAQARVQELINHYGEGTVLGWVMRGLPADVKYSTASSPPVKIK